MYHFVHARFEARYFHKWKIVGYIKNWDFCISISQNEWKSKNMWAYYVPILSNTRKIFVGLVNLLNYVYFCVHPLEKKTRVQMEKKTQFENLPPFFHSSPHGCGTCVVAVKRRSFISQTSENRKRTPVHNKKSPNDNPSLLFMLSCSPILTPCDPRKRENDVKNRKTRRNLCFEGRKRQNSERGRKHDNRTDKLTWCVI